LREKCTEKRILRDHEVSKRGKEKSHRKDVRILKTREEKQKRGKNKRIKRERERERKANKRSWICVEMRASEG